MNYIQNYIHDIPTNTATQMVYAAGAGFFIETILSSDPTRGLIVAGFSALATIIHGLVTPFFKSLTGRTQLTWGEEMCRTFSAIIGSGMVAKALGYNSVIKELFTDAILYGIIYFLSDSNRSTHKTNVMILFPRLSFG